MIALDTKSGKRQIKTNQRDEAGLRAGETTPGLRPARSSSEALKVSSKRRSGLASFRVCFPVEGRSRAPLSEATLCFSVDLALI
jgi:hypothetical protein